MRYVLEGTWTGYVERQRRVVHREIVDEKRAARLRKLYAIVYTDGTSLLLDLRPALPRERVETVNSYGSLIRSAEAHGGSRVLVADLKD